MSNYQNKGINGFDLFVSKAKPQNNRNTLFKTPNSLQEEVRNILQRNDQLKDKKLDFSLPIKRRTFSEIGVQGGFYNQQNYSDQTSRPPQNIKNNKPLIIPQKDIQPQKINPPTLEEIQKEKRAFDLLEKTFIADENIIKKDDTIKNPYTNFEATPNQKYLLKSRKPYPNMVYKLFNSKEQSFSFSNYFTPLNLIYFVKNNTIILWNYVNNQTLSFNEISDPIYSLLITQPKPNVFSLTIHYVMFVATQSNIYLLAITRQTGALDLHKTEFVFSTNNQIVTAMISTINQRVFVASKDEEIWELHYENTKSFFGFGKRAKRTTVAKQDFYKKIFPFSFYFPKHTYFYKLAVDNTRHILYALCYYSNTNEYNIPETVKDSKVFVFDLGPEGKGFENVGIIAQSSIEEQALDRNFMGSYNEDPNINSYLITDIVPIERNEYKQFQLMLIINNKFKVCVDFEIEIDMTSIKNEEEILSMNTNIIYRKRLGTQYSFYYKDLPPVRHFNSNFDDAGFKSISYINQKGFLCYKDDGGDCYKIDVLEDDLTNLTQKEGTPLLCTEFAKDFQDRLNISTFSKEFITIFKVPENLYRRDCDMKTLLKRSDSTSFLYPNIKFLDNNLHFSYTCMHEFATQLFLDPEEYVLMLSNEIQTIIRLRPIDILLTVIINSGNQSSIRPSSRDYQSINSTTSNPDDFEQFIKKYGVIETTFMLFTIMLNKSFSFYVQNQSFNSSSSLDENKEFIEIKNNEKIISKAEQLLFKILSYTLNSVNSATSISNGSLAQQKKEEQPQTLGTARYENKEETKNFISTAMMLFISRVARLFWEEPLFTKNFNMNSLEDYFLTNTIEIHQLHYIKNIFSSFTEKIKNLKESLIQKGSDIEIKMRKLKNLKIDIGEVLGNNNLICDFENFQNEYEDILLICNKFNELLSFTEIIYNSASLKKVLERKKIKEIEELTFKDICNKTYPLVLKTLLEELFEVFLNENDYITVENKLNEMTSKCPSMLNRNESELIKAGFFIKITQYTDQDNVSKMNLINKATKLMLENPQSIKLEKVIDVLCENNEIRKVIQLCVAKAIYLHDIIEQDTERTAPGYSFSETQTIQDRISQNSRTSKNTLKESNFTEYKNCLYTVLKILNEVQIAIANYNPDVDYLYQIKDKPIPDYIKLLLANKTKEQLTKMQSEIIETILSYNAQFLHVLLFDHLKNRNMIEELHKISSPYVEAYLNSQISKDSTSPKRYVSLYKFYLNSKNYDAAIRILAQLVNYENPPESDDFITLADRREYCKHLIYALSVAIDNIDKLQFQSQENIKGKKIFTELREKIIPLESTLSIQNDIFVSLNKATEILLKKNTTSNPDSEQVRQQILSTERAADLLNRNIYNLDSLYYDFSKKFKIYELNMKIYFEMYSRGIKISSGEVKENFVMFCNRIRNDNKLLWPGASFLLFNQLFISFIEAKTQYSSFYSMLRDNKFNNQLEAILPFEFYANYIEELNKDLLFENEYDKDGDDYVLKSSLSYEGNQNIFWFIRFLKDKVHLPMWYIFEKYINFKTTDENDVYYLVIKLGIIKLWYENVNNFFFYMEKKKKQLLRQDYMDFRKFAEKMEDLNIIIKQFSDMMNRKRVTLGFTEEKKKALIQFGEFVSDKFEETQTNVVNYYNNVNSSKSMSNIDFADDSASIQREEFNKPYNH